MNTHPAALTVSCASMLAVLVAIPAGTAHGQFSFDTAVDYPIGPGPSGVAAGDFDGDGDKDLATTIDGPERIATLLNSSAGTFVAGPTSLLPASSSPSDLVAGDLDGDGDIDLAVSLRDDPNGAVRIMLNVGGAVFVMGPSIPVGDRPRGLSIADIDGDGDLDIGVANRDSNTASVLENNGTASFTVSTLALAGSPRATAFGNLDGGGALDFAVTDHTSRTVEVFMQSGGVFVPSASVSVGNPRRPDGLAAGDLNGDGLDDLAAATSDANLPENLATVLMNLGAATFSGPNNYDTAGSSTSDIIVVDLDCDAILDLVASNTDSQNVSLLGNLGVGTFGAAQQLDTGVFPGRAVAVDLDHDGDPDLAVANSGSNDVSVLINQTCAPCPWDVSGGDRLINVSDLLAVLAFWGPTTGQPADTNDDDMVDVTDLLAVLGNWGTCP